MDRGAWQATVHGVARIKHDLVNKPPPPPLTFNVIIDVTEFKSNIWSRLRSTGPIPCHSDFPLWILIKCVLL